ncbi:hypothetical protein MARBORIA2_19280 [Methanobrevibacter arboriphilus]|jgi:hypothetical protein|uniref:Uncharacterized protein n=1 Tax=Methanobrevibacter arboriphilus TaxID=39441 RepID=A0ACA8R1N6_METAZ|nr:nuclease [Methanobrevibacter arboriphilus]BBL61188.1 hypothetical protein MarbSA_02280 [Methanobrevibacter arboriphilus]GLI12838.1 hypothetical protein MARBORIA2_19280 [Methanobrevibacter arboriphilus]
MFEDDIDDKIYNLLISNGIDENQEYPKFVEKLYSKVEFLWKESVPGSYSHLTEKFFSKIDVVIILSGLYENNKEKIDALVDASKKYETPIVLVRPYGVEEVPENLESVAISLVGWNANCIVDSIKGALSLNSESCDI